MIDNNERPVEFKPLSWWEELLLPEEELPEYYRNKREYQFNNGEILSGMQLRSALHPILMALLKLNRNFIDKQSLTILKNGLTKKEIMKKKIKEIVNKTNADQVNKVSSEKDKKNNKPVIYAITHIGKFDYQIVSEAIRKHQYPFAGDPETMYRSGDGVYLGLNGVILCDTESKTDREIASITSIEVLNRNKNLLIYPEGVWNLSSDLFCLPLFPGIINMAHETGCDIVPVAVEQYGKDFIVNIGDNYNIGIKSDEPITKQEVEIKKDELRNILATLKWQIMERIPSVKRSDLGTYEEELEAFQNERLNEWVNPKTKEPYYNMEIVKHRTFKPKNVTQADDVFSYFANIKINKNNAFMFRKDSALPTEIQKLIMEKLDNELESETVELGKSR